MKSILAVLFAGLALAACGESADPPQTPRADLAVVNARLFDGTGGVIEDATITVDAGRIVAVEAGGAADAERVIDAAGATVLPGFIDTHVHLMFDPAVQPFNPDAESPDPERAAHRSVAAIERFREEALPGVLAGYLEAGFTTVRSTGDYAPAIFEIRDELERGDLRGPRLRATGPIFTAPNGHPAVTVCDGDEFCRTHLVAEVGDPDAARAEVRAVAEAGADAIKVVYDDADPGGVAHMSRDVLAAIVDEAHARDLPVIAHLYTPADALAALQTGVDRFVHMPNLTGAGVADADEDGSRALSLLIDRGTPVSATLAVNDVVADFFERIGREEFATAVRSHVAARQATVRALVDAGAGDLVAFGTDLPYQPAAEAKRREIAMLEATGLSNETVLMAMTANAARAVGMADEIGTVEAGKRADLVVVDGDPLADLGALQSVDVVIRDGEVVSGAG